MLHIRRIPLTWPIVARTFRLPDGVPYRGAGGWVKPPGTWGVRVGRWLYLIGWRR